MENGASLTIDFQRDHVDGYRRIHQRSPLLSSLEAAWNGAYLAYDYMPAGETPEVFTCQHYVVIFPELAAPIAAERTLGDQFRREQVHQGDILVVPAQVGCRAAWNAAGGVIGLGFEPTLFAHAAYEAMDPDRVELRPQFATPDPLVHQIGIALKGVLETYGSASRLYAETMVTALMVHLLHHYGTRSQPRPTVSNGLSPTKLRQVTDYIQAHLENDLGLDELAAIAQMSPHYFCQLFKRATGQTPHQFVIRCRVERARELLTQGNWAIAEVATMVGFVDQSHFHRHFKRLVGVTPGQVTRRSSWHRG